jgi:molybdenum cofactor cytidylyltransferase
MPTGIAPIVLAAGLCRRFGGDKLASIFRGAPLLGHCLSVLAEAREAGLIDAGVVVHRPDDPLSRSLAEAAGLQPIANPRPATGMAASLRLGLAALETLDSPDWAMVVLGDQPLLRLGTIEALAAAARPPMDMVRPVYRDSPSGPGHPVLVHRRLWAQAARLTGDQGFRTLAAWTTLRAGVIEVPGSNPDVDTPADLEALEHEGDPGVNAKAD